MMRRPFVILIALGLFLSACGTLEVNLYQTSTPAIPIVTVPLNDTSRSDSDALGMVYFWLSKPANDPIDPSMRLINIARLPGSCVVGRITCPPLEEIETPFEIGNEGPMPFTAWSPDGTMAVIPGTSNAKGYPTDLYLYKPEENSWRELAQFNFVDGAIWSPDGQWIAMRVQDGLGNVDIFVIQPDGSRLRNLTGVNFADPGDVGYLNIHAWLDDQVTIGTRDLNQESSVFYFVNPLDGEFEKSLSLSSYSIFSNTVNRLVIVRDVSSHIRSLDAIHPDGRIDYTIFTVNDQEISNLIWAPDGEKIAFLVRNLDKFSTQVFITNSDGSGITQFPSDTMLFSLAFSPDSKYVLADNHSSLYVANLESSELDIFPGLPSDWFALFPSWQPPIH